MFQDRYGNHLTATSSRARDLYVEAVDRLLGGAPDMHRGFEQVIEEDPGLALAHTGLARCRQIYGDATGARAAMESARAASPALTAREASHVEAMGLLVDGKVMAFCDGIQVGEPFDDVSARARKAGDERQRRIGPDSITVGFTGIPPFSRHLCDVRAERGMVVEARYVYLD